MIKNKKDQYKIELPIGCISNDFEKAKAYCANFNCIIHKSKRGTAHNVIESNEVINSFWLGANINLKSTSSLTITSAEEYLGK